MVSVDYFLNLLIPLTFNLFISVPKLSEIACQFVVLMEHTRNSGELAILTIMRKVHKRLRFFGRFLSAVNQHIFWISFLFFPPASVRVSKILLK